MNRVTASAAALLSVLASAYAAETEGTVRTVDPATRIIVMEDGTRVNVPQAIGIDGIEPGLRVRIVFEEGSSVATAIEPLS